MSDDANDTTPTKGDRYVNEKRKLHSFVELTVKSPLRIGSLPT